MPALRSQTKATRTARRSAVKLVPAVPEEYIPSVRDFESQSSYDDEQPEEIEEPWSYVFQRGDHVWIKLCGKWFPGTVWGNRVLKGLTHDRQTEGFYFCVYFWGKARKFVSPLNGDVKPDTAHTRQLLEEAGWLA